MAKYSKAAQKKVEKVMHEKKEGTLKSGSGKKVTVPKQAIAIGLSEARKRRCKSSCKKSRIPKKLLLQKTLQKKAKGRSNYLLNNINEPAYRLSLRVVSIEYPI